GDRQRRDVGQLEGYVPVPAGVDEPGGRMDQQPETAQARLAFEAADDVGRQLYPLRGRTEHELPGVQYERPLVLWRNLYELGEVLEVLLDVDDGGRVIAKDPEVTVDGDIDRRRLQAVVPERIDLDPTRFESLADAAV